MDVKNPIELKNIKFKEGSTGTTILLYTNSKRIHFDYLIVKPTFLSKCDNPKNMKKLIEQIEYVIGPLSDASKTMVKELYAIRYPVPGKI